MALNASKQAKLSKTLRVEVVKAQAESLTRTVLATSRLRQGNVQVKLIGKVRTIKLRSIA